MPESVNIRGIESLASQAAVRVKLQPDVLSSPETRGELLGRINELAEHVLGNYCYRVLSSQCYGVDIISGLTPITGGPHTEFTGSYLQVDFIDTEFESVFGGAIASTVPAAVFETLDSQRYGASLAQRYLQVAVPLVGQAVDIEPIPRLQS